MVWGIAGAAKFLDSLHAQGSGISADSSSDRPTNNKSSLSHYQSWHAEAASSHTHLWHPCPECSGCKSNCQGWVGKGVSHWVFMGWNLTWVLKPIPCFGPKQILCHLFSSVPRSFWRQPRCHINIFLYHFGFPGCWQNKKMFSFLKGDKWQGRIFREDEKSKSSYEEVGEGAPWVREPA